MSRTKASSYVVLGDVAALSADTDPDRDNDYIASYDASAAAAKKVPLKASKIALAVRQCVLTAALDSSGYNAAITTGSGLRPGLDASPTPMVLAFANGFDEYGSVDYVTKLSADVADPLGADLKLSNTAFLHETYVSPTSATLAAGYVPPQYGYAFDRTKGALLNFEGSNGATTTTDDFGNTWTANGNAQITTAQAKFGTSSSLLDGAGDYWKSTNFTTLGDGSWEASLWFRINALPGVGVNAMLFCAGTVAPGFGVFLGINNTAGTSKLTLYLSSDGSTHNIASASLGANTVWALNQWNKVRLVFDALGGTYRAYLSLNAAAETQDISVASTARICAFTNFTLGADGAATQGFNGWVDAFRFLPCATNTTTETPSAAAPTIADYPVHFFSIPEMKMYEVTAASGAAGTNPTLTQRNRLFVAEADTSGAAVTAVRNYAIRGQYDSGPTQTPAANTSFSLNHNLGTLAAEVEGYLKCVTTQNGYAPGDEIVMTRRVYFDSANSYGQTFALARNAVNLAIAATGFEAFSAKTGGGAIAITATSFKFGVRVRRAF